MVLLASSRLLETASVHLRRRPQRSRLPGPVSPPRPGPGSSGRPRHQEAAATATRPQTPLTGRRPTGRSFSGRRVASTGDRGLGRRPGWPRLLAPRPACARARSRTPLSQLPRGLLSRPCGSLTSAPAVAEPPSPFLLAAAADPAHARFLPLRLPTAGSPCCSACRPRSRLGAARSCPGLQHLTPAPGPDVLQGKAQPKSGHLVTRQERPSSCSVESRTSGHSGVTVQRTLVLSHLPHRRPLALSSGFSAHSRSLSMGPHSYPPF